MDTDLVTGNKAFKGDWFSVIPINASERRNPKHTNTHRKASHQ